jgi:hypothetical protein
MIELGMATGDIATRSVEDWKEVPDARPLRRASLGVHRPRIVPRANDKSTP